MNIKERDELLFGKYDKSKYAHGIRFFDSVNAELLQTLVDKGFIELDGCKNSSPTTEEFLAFMKSHPSFTAHGYALLDDKNKCHMTIEGIESSLEPDCLVDFIHFARFADAFEFEDSYYCWWD